jgi:hypothetical protein
LSQANSMARLGLLQRLPAVTLAMSLPLFFSVQLRRPPEFLRELPFVALWSWGVLATVTVPVLIVIEGAICVWLLWHREVGRSTLARHGIALCVAALAEGIFVIARRSSV